MPGIGTNMPHYIGTHYKVKFTIKYGRQTASRI